MLRASTKPRPHVTRSPLKRIPPRGPGSGPNRHRTTLAGTVAIAWASAVVLLATAPSGSAAIHAIPDPKPAAQIDPVFDCYAANSAWGLTFSGKAVGRDGRIVAYRRRGSALPDVVRDGERSFVAAGDLAKKFEGAVDSGQADADVLAKQIATIGAVAAGHIAQSDTGVRDAGSSTCHAYVADTAGRRYRDVMIGSDGGVADRRIVNDAPAAKALLDWLRSLGVAK